MLTEKRRLPEAGAADVLGFSLKGLDLSPSPFAQSPADTAAGQQPNRDIGLRASAVFLEPEDKRSWV